jgi:uncharacterized membrane protein
MRARLQSWWFTVAQSLWFLPALLTGGAVALAILTVWVDQTVLRDRRAELGWLFSGGAEGARGVLEAIAGTMITVTALVFSLTVVALQLAASQLSPRVLHTFMSDRATQVVMGCFIGTFTYALLVLRVVRAPLEEGGGFVPSLSVTVASGLALVSVGLLIFFVHHVANAMRASVVIDRATDAAIGLIEHLGPADPEQTARPVRPVVLPPEPGAVIWAEASGYLQSIDTDALVHLAERRQLTIRLDPTVGSFVLPGAALALVWPPAACDEPVTQAVHGALVLGPERTLQADVALGVQQLSDIAVKALSPGINDPTTATICIDRLSEVLVAIGRGPVGDEVHHGEAGHIRVVLPRPTFAELVGVAFGGIRHYGSGNPVVAAHLVDALGRIATLVLATHRQPLADQAALVLAAVRAAPIPAADREHVEQAARWLIGDAGA